MLLVVFALAGAAVQAQPGDGPGANFGLTRSAIWLKVVLRTASHTREDRLLEIAYPPLDRLELYSPGGTGFDKQVGGDLHPFAQRVQAALTGLGAQLLWSGWT